MSKVPYTCTAILKGIKRKNLLILVLSSRLF